MPSPGGQLTSIKPFFMRKLTPFVVPAILFGIILSSANCRKAIDIIKSPQNGLADYEACNIRQITAHLSEEWGSDSVVYTFSYNAAGDPLTVRNTAVSTGNPNAVFKYDKYGRMKEMIRPYENGAFETWTKYSYNRLDQIVLDTQYIFGTYFDSVPVPYPQLFGYTVSQFTYDPFNRVSSRADTYVSPDGSTSGMNSTFQYDADGNLVIPRVTYDGHLSIRRTNTTWMFICNNYSVSNTFHAITYNTHGLPLLFDDGYEALAQIVPQTGRFEVKYACP